MAGMSAAERNGVFLANSNVKNHFMPPVNITAPGQVIDIELESVPGWASAIDLDVVLALNIALAETTGVVPVKSPFAPFNIFSRVELSLGGGPFQAVNMFYYYLRDIVSHFGWTPALSSLDMAYSDASLYNFPAVTGTAGQTTANNWKFPVRIPLQLQHGSPIGHIPLGDGKTKAKIRLTVTPSLYSADQYLSPLYGGTDVTVTFDDDGVSTVQTNYEYRTSPVMQKAFAEPVVGNVLNVQERAITGFGAGSLFNIPFNDPFQYLRLWMIFIDGTGAPNTASVSNLELDLAPGVPKFEYTLTNLSHYFAQIRRKYQTDLPTGVFCLDLFTGSDPANPNDNQIIDGSFFQTLQARVAVASGTDVTSPAKLITYAEALSPVRF